MKANKELKLILTVLLIVLISVVSFMGVNVEERGIMKNLVAKYKLGMDLEGYRSIALKVDESMKKDEAEDEKATEENAEASTEENAEKPVNDPETLTNENYEISKKIIINRLKSLDISDYIVRQDFEDKGKISIQIPEDEKTDKAVEIMQQAGDFKIIDTETKEVLMDNSDIKDIKVGYGQTQTGIGVYLTIQFDKDGITKLRDITNKYVKLEEKTEENKENAENTENTETANAEAENTEATAENTSAETAEQTAEKTITMKIDDETIMETSFSSEIQNGMLQLTVGSSASTTADLQSSLENGATMASLLKSGKMPVKYVVDQNKYILSDITRDQLNLVIAIAISIFTAMIIYMIAEYKENGITMVVSMVGYLSILLLVLRYTNVVLTIEGLSAIGISVLINFLLQIGLLKNNKFTGKDIKKEIIKGIEYSIPLFIIAVVFSFSKWTPIVSFGMTVFWGVLEAIIYNLVVTDWLYKNQ